ncbi:type I polyketide synthase [Kitasatospora griseola]|uniref:type I polyketide synthase n=1 Tax=Kitasatospora griseola TaxID=2064 RepID=UPI0036631157
MYETDFTHDEQDEHVAVIGMAGRFPGAPDVESLWQQLAAGRETVSALTDEELLASGVDPELLRHPDYVKAKGVLADADRFDAGFFGFSPREAELLDPQQRVFLECAFEALEAAGCDPRTFDGRIGVFAGASLNSYLLRNLPGDPEALEESGIYRTLLASDKDFLATRVSYKLGLRGPGITVQTACSTSLTAVHLACQSLLSGECDIALAGGVSVSSPPAGGHLYEQGGILSADGHCRPFDAAAGGTVAGNGAGVVVLRRLADARDAQDAVQAVVLGSAINNDGALKAGYTAPSVDGQAEVIAEALAVAGVAPRTIGYVEAHGTGTALGDPIEVAALTQAYQLHPEATDETGYCALGAVKGNVGHLDAAAGVTAFIKAVLALRHRAIPPIVNFSEPNPGLKLETSPFYVPTELRDWPGAEHPRRAGVSAFGIGGTNVHVVLQEAAEPRAAAPATAGRAELLTLSGRTPEALAANAERLAERLDADPELPLRDAAHTLARRRGFEHRAAVAAAAGPEGRSAAVAALRRLTGTVAAEDAPVAFLFPGQGAQYVAMAHGLYREEPAFAAELDACAELFTAELGADPRTLLFPGLDADPQQAAAALARTEITQPVLFLVEYALAKFWMSQGVHPRAMAGHSIGEYVAACLAGVFSLPDAVRLVAARGRLVQSMPAGEMLAVFLPEAELAPLLDELPELDLAAVNSTALCVAAGPAEAVERLRKRLVADGTACRRLHTSHAFHSASMDAAVQPFTDVVRGVELRAPRIPFCSGLTGQWITDEQATSPAYWGEHLRGAVRFRDVLGLLLDDPELLLLEVGPGRSLTNFAQQHDSWSPERTAVDSLPHPKDSTDDRTHLLAGLGALWSAGAPVDRAAVCGGGALTALPGYAFQRRRYWIEAGPRTAPKPRSAALPLDDWFTTPGWRRLPAGPRTGDARDAVWAVLGTEQPLGAELARQLEARGATVRRIGRADGLDRDACATLIRSLDTTGEAASIRLVHLGALTDPAAGDGLDADRLAAAQRTGFDTLATLAQGLLDAAPARPVLLDVLASGVFEVTGDEPLHPEGALLLGPCTVIPQEVTGVECRLLDVGAGEPAAVAAGLLDAAARREPQLALRGRHWWSRTFDAVELPAPEAGPGGLRDGGGYLITGGFGGVGLAIAEQIARTVRRPVLGLLGRSPLAADDPALHRLTELGAEVLPLRADVTDAARTAEAVALLRARAGAVHGVVHAAGLPSRGLLMGKTPEDAAAVLAAKTLGTLVLDRVCADDDLDFLLLCSSLTGLLGGPGQSDYAAANAFLDAYAQWRRRSGAPVTAVAWDTWRGVGMAAGLDESAAAPGTPTAHPLLRRLPGGDGNSRGYTGSISTADSWIIADHRIMGHGLVPGTAYLELVRAAVADLTGAAGVELRDVLFAQPVIVPDGQSRSLWTALAADGEELRFTVRSNHPATGPIHAMGTAVALDEAPPVRDLAALRAEFAEVAPVDDEAELKRLFKLDLLVQGNGIEFTLGPRWHCLRGARVTPERLLVSLRLPEEHAGDLDAYLLHPALLDVAGVSARIQMPDKGYYLPFTYRSLKALAPLTAEITCDVALKGSPDGGESLTCDIDMLAEDGRVLVRITDFTLKRINDLDGMRDQVAEAVAAGTAPAPAAPQLPEALRLLAEGITEQDGQEALARVLANPEAPAQLVLSHRELSQMRAVARSITPALLAGGDDQAAPALGRHPRPDLPTPYQEPATDEERAVAEIWQEVLGVEQVGTADDFFALGGHSLAAVQIGTKIRSRLGVPLDLRGFFEDPTVAHTVALLAAGGSEEDPEDAITARSDDESADLDELSDEQVEAMLAEMLAAETDDLENLA